MKKQKSETNQYVLASVILTICLIFAFFTAFAWIGGVANENCFDVLQQTTRQLGYELSRDMRRNIRTVDIMSRHLAQKGVGDKAEMSRELGMFELDYYFSSLALLYPDGRLVTSGGETFKSSNSPGFDELVAKGMHISNLEPSFDGSGVEQLHVCTPVLKDGNAVGVLIGTVDEELLPDLYAAQFFKGSSEYYLFESKSGKLIIDTRHKIRSNIRDYGGRDSKKGFESADGVRADFAANRGGVCAFFSNSAGMFFYCAYEPVGINDWMIMYTVDESTGMAGSKSISGIFVLLGVVEAIIFAAYFLWITYCSRRDSRAKASELNRVQYILEVEKTLLTASGKPALIEDALHRVADEVPAGGAFFVAFTCNEDQRVFCWSENGALKLRESLDEDFTDAYPQLWARLIDDGQYISYDAQRLVDGSAEESERLAEFGYTSMMMIPVYKPDGTVTGMIGVANLKRHLSSADRLECVMLSFASAVSNMEAFQVISRMGLIDELTGLRNRNCYQKELEKYERLSDDKLCCVYADADGLHEINNKYGHVRGDMLLRCVADALKSEFGADNAYRIGGDEFVAFCTGSAENTVYNRVERAERLVADGGYHISVGVACRSDVPLVFEMVRRAEENMYKSKRLFYQSNKTGYQIREMNRQLEEVLNEKRDLDVFRSVLASKYLGVYIVHIGLDTMRAIYIPPYFERYINRAGGKFSTAISSYIDNEVCPEFRESLAAVLDYDWIDKRLSAGIEPSLRYRKINGMELLLHIYRSPDYSSVRRECIWTFEIIDHK